MKRKAIVCLVAGLALILLCAILIPVLLSARVKPEIQTIDADLTPAILTNVGEAIDLNAYAIQTGDTTLDAGTITWTDRGKKIVSFTPEKRGAVALKAEADGFSKTVYVVAKEADETDYVLYETDFTASKADLRAEGWRFYPLEAVQVSDGVLQLGTTSENFSRAVLPDFLSDFAGYTVEVTASQTDCRDALRWCSIAFHIEGEDHSLAPFYHLCVRNHTRESTVEFAERLTSGDWNLISSLSRDLNMTDEPHNLTLSCFGATALFRIDGEDVFYTDAANAHVSGGAALISNYGTMNVQSLRVTLCQKAPEKPLRTTKLIDTSKNRTATNLTNYLSNQAYVTKAAYDALLSGDRFPVGLLYDPQSESLNEDRFRTILVDCMKRGIIPGFFIRSEDEVKALHSALNALDAPEAVVVSDAQTLRFARTLCPTVLRGILDKRNADSDTAPDTLARETAGSYAQGILLPQTLIEKTFVAQLREYEPAIWAFQADLDSPTDAVRLIASGANAVVTNNFQLIDDTQKNIFSAPNSLTRTPVWTAHRGDHTSFPENSMSSFLSAIEHGADLIETDVQLTSDGELILSHDANIDRTSDGAGKIADLTLSEIRAHRLYLPDGTLSDESFPTLNELLAAVRGKDVKILCELKGGDPVSAKKAAQTVKDAGMEAQVVFISFTGEQLLSAKEVLDAPTGLIFSSAGLPFTNDAATTINEYADAQDACLNYHSTMAVSYDTISAEFLKDACDRGMTLWTWTYTGSLGARVCTNFLHGMDGMTTNEIAYLKDASKLLWCDLGALSLSVGEAADIPEVNLLTYSKELKDVSASVLVRIIEGEDVIAFENGRLTALKEGTASVCFTYESALPDATPYTLYTQPVTITVHAP